MATINIKKEQYMKLLPLERQLQSARLSNYARLSAVEFDDFCEVYKDIYGVELTRMERNCNNCRLKALKKVANDYFYFKDTYFKRWGRNPEEAKVEDSEVEEKQDNNEENKVEE